MDAEILTNNKNRFIELCKTNIHRDGIDELLDWLNKSDFFVAPASTRFHGSYKGGLLEHSLNVYEQFQRLRESFPEVECSDETATIITLFHDLCKANMYTTEKRNRKNENGQWESYDAYKFDEKFVFGGFHGPKSVYLVQYFMKLNPQEAVAIASHMGAFENDKCGQAYDDCPLAFLLHVADGLASYIVEKE